MPIQPMPQESLGTELVNTWINADYAAQEERALSSNPPTWDHPSPEQTARLSYNSYIQNAAIDEVNEWAVTSHAPHLAMIAEHRLTPNPFEERSYLNTAYTLSPQAATRVNSSIRNFTEAISTVSFAARRREIAAFTDAEFTDFKTKAATVCDVQNGRTGRVDFSLGINALTFLRLEATRVNQSVQQHSVRRDDDGKMLIFGRPVKIINSIPNGHVELVLESNYSNAIDIYQAQREAVSARSNRNTEVRAI